MTTSQATCQSHRIFQDKRCVNVKVHAILILDVKLHVQICSGQMSAYVSAYMSGYVPCQAHVKL